MNPLGPRPVVSEASGAGIECLWVYDFTGDSVPKVGEFSIILDGAGNPRALIETATVVSFHLTRSLKSTA